MRSQDFFILISPLPVDKVITSVNQILVENNLFIEANGNSSIRVHDYEIEDEEFYFVADDIINPTEDLKKLINAPAGGYIAYQFSESDVLVGFDIIDCKLYEIDTISISLQFGVYWNNKNFIYNLVKEIHKKLNALRTIGGDSISEDVDNIVEALLETKSGGIKKKYPIDYL